MSRLVTRLAGALQERRPRQRRSSTSPAASDVTAELDSLSATAADCTRRGRRRRRRHHRAGAALPARRDGLREPHAPRVQRGDRGGHRRAARPPAERAEPDRRRLGSAGRRTTRRPADRRPTRCLDVATDNRVPAVAVTETLPEGEHYVAWQRALQQAFLSAVAADRRLTPPRPVAPRRRPHPGRPLAVDRPRPRRRAGRVHRGARRERLRQDQPAEGGPRAAPADRGHGDAARRPDPSRRPAHRLHPAAAATG